jgi:hypothetical protein
VPFALQLVAGETVKQTSRLAVGTEVVTATYAGDDVYRPAADSVTVAVRKAATAVILSAPSSVPCGQTVTISADLTNPRFLSTNDATGAFTFSTADRVLQTRNGLFGSFSLSGLPGPGQHTVTVAYPGDANFLASQSTFPLTVVPRTMILAAPANVLPSTSGNVASLQSTMPSNATYAWTIENGTIESGQGTKSITFSAGTAGTVRLGLTVVHATVCSYTTTADVRVLAQPTTKRRTSRS